MGCCSEDKCSCCGGHKHHHHHHQCCCDSKSCHADDSCDYEHEEDCHSKSHKLLEIADEAWVELLKEKIKEHIKATDPKLDELAKIVAEANHKRWKHKMQNDKCAAEAEQCCEDFENQLCKLFSCSDGSCSKPK